jgi:hypothetical protein
MKTQTTFVLSILVIAAVVGLAIPAQAQEAPATPPAAPAETPPVHHVRTSSGGNGLGIGVAAFVSGLNGPQVVYDFGIWHIEGILGFDRRDGGGMAPATVTTFDFGVSAWYHLSMGESSDFSLGGGFGFINQSNSAGGGSNNATVIEPGAQIRAFITPNVALHARLGISMVFGDGVGSNDAIIGMSPHVSLNARPMGGFGLTYFFR